jgi:type IV secretion system protein VirD4
MTAHSNNAVVQGLITFALMLLSVWTMTQWAAAALRFQPALGVPFLQIFGWNFCAQWLLFPLRSGFARCALRVFDVPGLIASFGVVFGNAATRADWRDSRGEVITTHGSARWAQVSDIGKARLLDQRGVNLGQFSTSVLRDDGPSHVLAAALTRYGNGVGLVVSTLLSWMRSTFIHDINGENWKFISGYHQMVFDCLRFDPTAANSLLQP